MLESSKNNSKVSKLSSFDGVCSIHFNFILNVQPLIGIGWGCCCCCCSPLLFLSYNPTSILQTVGTQLCLSVCLSSDLVTSDTIAIYIPISAITTSFLLVWWCLHQSINVCKNAVIIYNTEIKFKYFLLCKYATACFISSLEFHFQNYFN